MTYSEIARNAIEIFEEENFLFKEKYYYYGEVIEIVKIALEMQGNIINRILNC
ncbi:MAG: hypothetical protein J6X18_00600 [Bacteroidales bacterium]|nr:hypothetical protein [Bacteroidales bacterium]